MEITSIATAIGIVKSLTELTNSLGDAVPEDVRDKIRDLYGTTLTTQTELLEARQREIEHTDEIRKLKAELSRMNDWEATKARYTLRLLDGNVSVYVQTADIDARGPTHWLCANCFEDGRKSHLQPHEITKGRRQLWRCSRCKTEATMRFGVSPGANSGMGKPLTTSDR